MPPPPTNPIDDDQCYGDKLLATIDNFQKRFFCNLAEICAWKKVLLKRYRHLESNVKIDIEHKDLEKHPVLPQCSLCDPTTLLVRFTPPPENVSSTVIRLFVNGHKYITFTLYFKQNEKGCLLAQGVHCSDFARAEVNNLEQFVIKLLKADDTDVHIEEKLVNELLSIPLPPTSFDFNTIKAPAMSSAEGSVSDPTLEEVTNTEQDNDTTSTSFTVSAPHPPPAHTDSLQTPSPLSSPKSPAVKPRTRAHRRRRGLVTTPKCTRNLRSRQIITSSLPSTQHRLDTLEAAVDDLQENKANIEEAHNLQEILHTKADIEALHDLKVQLKNTLKREYDEKFDDYSAKLAQLSTRVSQLESENAKLKCKIDSLKKSSQKTNVTPSQSSSESNSNLNSSTQKTSTTMHIPSSLPECEDKTLTASSEHHLNSPMSAKGTPKASPNDQTAQQTCYNVAVSNQFDAFTLSTEPSDTDNLQVQPSQIKHNKIMTDTESPREKLAAMSVSADTTMLLIGDSVLRFIDPRKIQPEGERMEKLFVPGLRIDDLQSWLHTTKPCPGMKQVTVHVGVNSCPAGPVSTEEWLDLVAGCRKTFPRASLRLSTIIPARGRHNLNNAITPSNNNLRTACQRVGVMVIDNTKSFTAQTGAPRLVMYSGTDPRHPSRKGAIRLALNFKYAASDRASNNNNETRSVSSRQYRRPQHSFNTAKGGSANGPLDGNLAPSSSQPPPPSLFHFPPLPTVHQPHAVPPYGPTPIPPSRQQSTAQPSTYPYPLHHGPLATQNTPAVTSGSRPDAVAQPTSGPGHLQSPQFPLGWGALHPHVLPLLNMLAAQHFSNGLMQARSAV